MSVIPDQVGQEDLFALLVLKSHQLSFREKQMMLSDLATVKAQRLQDENYQMARQVRRWMKSGEQSEN